MVSIPLQHVCSFLKGEGEKNHIHSSVYYQKCNNAVEHWNGVIKECILSAEQIRKSRKHAVTEFLQNYRAPHSTTGVSPSEVLYHCNMHTKLNVFSVCPKSDKCAQVKDIVVTE